MSRRLPSRSRKAIWDTVFTKCGRSYYITEYEEDNTPGVPRALTLAEYKDPNPPTLVDVPLSPADKANGYQYEGVTRLAATMYRLRSNSPKQRQWSEWIDGGRMSVRMTELQGKWIFEDLGAGADLILHRYVRGVSIETDLSDYTKQKLSCAVASSDNPFLAYPYPTAQDLADQEIKSRLEQYKRTQQAYDQDRQNSVASTFTPSDTVKFICPGALLRDRDGKDYRVDRPRKVQRVETLGNMVMVDLADDHQAKRSGAPRYSIQEGYPRQSCSGR